MLGDAGIDFNQNKQIHGSNKGRPYMLFDVDTVGATLVVARPSSTRNDGFDIVHRLFEIQIKPIHVVPARSRDP